MSDPHVYPEAPNAPLWLPAATGVAAPTFTGIQQLAAPDPSTPKIPKTMFIRVAMSGNICPGVTSATAPNFYLRADTGDAVLINNHTQPPNLTYVILRKPGGNPVDYVGEGSAFLESNNVFRWSSPLITARATMPGSSASGTTMLRPRGNSPGWSPARSTALRSRGSTPPIGMPFPRASSSKR